MAVTSTKRPIRRRSRPFDDETPEPGQFDPVITTDSATDSSPVDPVNPIAPEEDEDDDADGQDSDGSNSPGEDGEDGAEQDVTDSDTPDPAGGDSDQPGGGDGPSLEDQGFTPVKRGRGRPPGSTKKKPEEMAHSQPDYLPRPSNFRFVNKPVLFFRYWETVFKTFPDRVVCYVYRQWPVIDRERHKKTKNIDKPQQPINPGNHRQEILHRYGSGDYKFILSDTLLSKAICTATVSGLREMADFPPMVDLDDLVLEDPANRPYIERLKQRGVKLPGEAGYEQADDKDGDSMANKALDTLGGALSNMTDRMMDVQEKRIEQLAREQRRGEREQPENVEQMAAGSAMEIVSNAAHMANTILKEATDKVSTALATSNDPLKNITALIEVAKQMAPKEKEDTSGAFLKTMLELQAKAAEKQEGLYMMMINQSNARLESLERILVPNAQGIPGMPGQTGVAPMGGGQVSTVTPQGGFLSDLDNMVKVKTRLEEIGILPGRDDRRGGDGWTSYIPMILTGLQFIAGSYASIVHNQAVAKLGEGHAVAPPPPPMPQPQPGEDEQTPGPPYQPGIGMDGQQTQPGQVQQGQGQDMGITTMISFLRKIEQPLLMHLKQGLSGADFADWLILSEEKGQLIYDSLVESGKSQIISLLRLHPPIWSVVAGIPQRFDKFLDEFLAGPGSAEDDDGGDGGVDVDSSGRHNAREDSFHLGQTGQTSQPVGTVATGHGGMAPLDPEVLPPVGGGVTAQPARPAGQPQIIDVKPVRVKKRPTAV